MSKNNKEAILYLLPAAVLFLVFYYWPLLQNIYLSVFSWNMISHYQKFVGLDNFITIFSSAELIKILINTVLFVAIMLVLNFVLPYFYSFILGHLVHRWTAFYRSALFLPSTLSLAVASILFLWIYNPLAGPINIVLSQLISLHRVGLKKTIWLFSLSARLSAGRFSAIILSLC